jgi:hypothetical protein
MTPVAGGSGEIGKEMTMRDVTLGWLGAVCCLFAGSLFGACGSGTDGVNRADSGGSTSSGGSGPAGTGGSSPEAVDSGNGTIIVPPEGTEVEGCAATAAEAQIRPVLLGVIVDRSASWDWTPAVTALKGFFADPRSAGLSASLQFFPLSKDKGENCVVSNYASPAVQMTALPEAVAFASAIDAIDSDLIGTPTGTALKGTIDYLNSIAPVNPGAQFAMLIVTDGEPHGCGDTIDGVSLNSVDGVSKLAASVSGTIPTYVIGYKNVTGLDQIAQSGGTSAIIVDADDPVLAQEQFIQAIETIRWSLVPCDVDIPPPPKGETFDQALVNVSYAPSGQEPMPMYLSADCTHEQGWRYDNPDVPTRIELCPSACDSIKSAGQGRLDVEFGCATRIY